MKVKAWMHKKDLDDAKAELYDTGAGAFQVFATTPYPANKRQCVEVELSLPDPPKPFEGEVWIDSGGKICALPYHINHKNSCRKIHVREVQD